MHIKYINLYLSTLATRVLHSRGHSTFSFLLVIVVVDVAVAGLPQSTALHVAVASNNLAKAKPSMLFVCVWVCCIYVSACVYLITLARAHILSGPVAEQIPRLPLRWAKLKTFWTLCFCLISLCRFWLFVCGCAFAFCFASFLGNYLKLRSCLPLLPYPHICIHVCQMRSSFFRVVKSFQQRKRNLKIHIFTFGYARYSNFPCGFCLC